MDKLTVERRSANMRRIRSKNTKPEMVVRGLVYSWGYRYRIHAKDLPGKPDIVFRSRRKAIFVHGCFWHQHPDCSEGRVPKSRTDYWRAKLDRNRERDLLHNRSLKELGWRVMTVWECELKNTRILEKRLNKFLEI